MPGAPAPNGVEEPTTFLCCQGFVSQDEQRYFECGSEFLELSVTGKRGVRLDRMGKAKDATQGVWRRCFIERAQFGVELFGQSRVYSYTVDNWALGCTLAEMVLGKPLFPGDTEQEVLDRIFRYYHSVPYEVEMQLVQHGLTVTCQRAGSVRKVRTNKLPSLSYHADLHMLRCPVRSIIVKMLQLAPEERNSCLQLLVELNFT